MEATSHSLLGRAALGAIDSWAQLDHLYRRFLVSWFQAHGVSNADAEDLTQEVMTVVFQEIKGFAHSGRTGAFRTWLRSVCLHRLLAFKRSHALRGAAIGGTDFQVQLGMVADSDADQAGHWDRQHDVEILRQMIESLVGEFEEKTLRAFHRLVFDNAAAPEVAAELGLSVGAVYVAKSRILRRLRTQAAGLIEGSDLG